MAAHVDYFFSVASPWQEDFDIARWELLESLADASGLNGAGGAR